MEKKAQSAIELVILVGFILFFFILFISVLEININQKNSEKIDFSVREIALIIQDEISLAHSSSDGYSRDFFLPYSAYTRNYTAQINQNLVYIVTDDSKHAISLNVFNVTGQPKQGTNNMRKIEGLVYLN